MKQLHTQLTDIELDTLDGFLAAPVREDTAMDVATLEGFLVALTIGPETVLPSDWLPWVWDLRSKCNSRTRTKPTASCSW